VKEQEEVRQECDRVRRKWGKFVRGSARKGEGVSGGQQEVEMSVRETAGSGAGV